MLEEPEELVVVVVVVVVEVKVEVEVEVEVAVAVAVEVQLNPLPLATRPRLPPSLSLFYSPNKWLLFDCYLAIPTNCTVHRLVF